MAAPRNDTTHPTTGSNNLFPQGFIVEGANRLWETVLPIGERKQYKAGQQVSIPISGQAQGIFYLCRGSVRLTYTSIFGAEKIQLIIREGMIFNEISALQRLEGASICFVCLEDVRAFFFHRDLIFCPRFVRDHPDLILNLLESMSAKSLRFFNHSCDLGVFDSFQNTCRALYYLWDHYGRKQEFPPEIGLGELSAHLGIHRASLHKILKRLVREQVIECFSRRKFSVLNSQRLEEYAINGDQE